jgi:hypothetical protein
MITPCENCLVLAVCKAKIHERMDMMQTKDYAYLVYTVLSSSCPLLNEVIQSDPTYDWNYEPVPVVETIKLMGISRDGNYTL